MNRRPRATPSLIAALACTARVALGREAPPPANAPAEVDGEKAVARAEAPVASVRIVPSATKVVDWRIRFTK